VAGEKAAAYALGLRRQRIAATKAEELRNAVVGGWPPPEDLERMKALR